MGGSAPDFPLNKKKQNKKHMALKHWILPIDHFKRIHFIQNSFHGAQITFRFLNFFTGGGGFRRLVENSTIFFNPSLIQLHLLNLGF